MFREFVILLCAGTLVCGSASHSVPNNAPAKSSVSTRQDNVALPSEASYQKVAPPSAKYLPNPVQYEVKPAVVDTISEAPKSVPVQSYGSVNANQQTATFSATVASDPSSPEYSNVLERYAPSVPPIMPYFAVPVAAKSVTIGSHGVGNGHGSVAYTNQGQNVPVFVYTTNANQAGPYYTVPHAATQSVVETHRTVNTHPAASHGSQQVDLAVAYATNSAAPRPFSAVPQVSANTATIQSQRVFTAHSPAVSTYHVNHVQAVNPQVSQYVPAPKITYNVNPTVKTVPLSAVPVASKSVTIEAYNSVTAHPPPAPKYVTGPALIRYAPAPAPVAKPVPVPVIYDAVQTHHHAAQQVVVVPTAPTYQAPVRAHPIPVPVQVSSAAVQYQPAPVPVGPQKGYVVYSPASEVSHVTFNGLGVSYGW